ncbi:hypothetical protein HS1genome_0169 [Sulfodiicoccus acidiphilus]|uniref:Uncharacterized protein n=1 Tax=Sulfodiicoccus acidiphilus TaxID=1670455 RepID=A0A348B0S8_9CREN|nr:hypothetical protein [Sulfodiicoccus acidiphilus]BBD71780.1 hypothetical protein HS1genome_0169 [Sulfodiicoccus acidiphilus]GGT99156.1 hypothetical protein GCM10007116_15630 [Sulfodiicoccus acidiphilus]
MDLEKLLDQSTSKVKRRVEQELSRAKEEALKLVEQSYLKSLDHSTSKIRELTESSKERIEGEKARLDVENKRALIDERNYWLDKAYSKLQEALGSYFASKEYEEALIAIIKREITEGVEVVCSPRDVEKVRKAIGGFKNIKIRTSDKIIGGIQLYYPEISMMKDFSIDLFAKQVFETNKEKLAQILFEGE